MEVKKRVLTGITTTGAPHLGNYVSVLKPAIRSSRFDKMDEFYFLADYHALVKCRNPYMVHRSTQEIAAAWIALGLDTEKVIFYRQSDIAEISQLCWLLTCITSKGAMNRSHAYKSSVDNALRKNSSDFDHGTNMGLFNYPILMAADILIFNAHQVLVGKDQIQHIEMCRDIAIRFNHVYESLFNIPKAMIIEGSHKMLPGLDGRKMSKSYGNIIPLFSSTDNLYRLISEINTNNLKPGEPKETNNCVLFELYSAFADFSQVTYMRKQYMDGVSWNNVKFELFELLDSYFSSARNQFNALMKSPEVIEKKLQQGAIRAREHSEPFMKKLLSSVGIKGLDQVTFPYEKSARIKRSLSDSKQLQIEKGKQKAVFIAKKREIKKTAKLKDEVDSLVFRINDSIDPQSTQITILKQLKHDICDMSSKISFRKQAQIKYDLLQTRLK